MTKRLENKVSIVTGGASGIGEATVKTFLEEGSKVCVVDNNKEKLETFSSYSKDLITCLFDVTDENGWKENVTRILSKWNKIDVLVNNAGISLRSSFEEMNRKEWDNVFAVNSTAVIFGLIDVADKLGLEENEEDFGQTLATWCIGDGFYVVLPLFGPSNVRDTAGMLLSYTTDPINAYAIREGEAWVIPFRTAANAVDQRSKIIDEVNKLSSYLKYPPLGNRTYGVNRAQSYGINFENYVEQWNDSSILVFQIEYKK